MANWKIQDIAPPKKLTRKTELATEEPKKHIKRRGRRLPGWLTKGVLPLFVLLILSVGTVHLFFANAKVSVWPETRQVKLLSPIVAEVDREQLDKEERIIPARTLTEEKKATRLFSASSNTIKVNKASGTIRVFNAYTTSPYTLIVQTRFVSEEGRLFRIPVRISIPGFTDEGPGFIDVEVVAGESGEEYNIGPSSFSVPGLSGSAAFTAIYAASTESMTGGSERSVSIVSEDDIENAKESLIEELTLKVTEDLLSRVPDQMVATRGLVSVEVTEADSLVRAGAELDQFNVSVSLVATIFMVPRVDLTTFVDSFLARELKEGERIAEDKTVTSFEQIIVNRDLNTAALKLGITTTIYQFVDPTELKIKLRGKSKEEAESILATFNAFSQAEISLWPFWLSSLPGNVDKLKIQVIVD